MDKTRVCSFYISDNFESSVYNYTFNDDTKFEFLGLSTDELKPVGTFFLTILNNIEFITQILNNSKEKVTEPFCNLTNYIKKELKPVDKLLSEIIIKELNNVFSNHNQKVHDLESEIKHFESEIREHKLAIDDKLLYDKYYDDMIYDIGKRIKTLKDPEEIEYDKNYIKDLVDEKNNPSKGKEYLKSMIINLEEEKSQSIKELNELDEISFVLNNYIDILINTIFSYKYYFDMYYGILNTDDLKNKDISYFQSIFGINFEIPRHIVYSSYKRDNKIYPLTNLISSVVDKMRKEHKDITDYNYYQEMLLTINSLNANNKIIYLKSFQITKLKDILNIYFYHFTNEKICIRKCPNCNKYFIPTSRTDEVYCDRISPQNPNKTCKEYGVKKAYREKINSNEVKKAHYNAGQFFRMKIKRASTEKEKATYEKIFEKYKINYEKQKKKYLDNKLSDSDFTSWITAQKEI